MADLSIPARNSVAAQQEMFRLAQKECGLSMRAISEISGISFSTLKGWRDGSAMPAWAIGELGEAGVPDHLLSMVTAPWRRSVLTDEETDADLDDAAEAADEFATSVRRARSPKSPGGTAIVPQERAEIIPIGRRARAKLVKAA
jgi:hypothetical protein